MILQITECQPTVDGSRVGIGSNGRTPPDALETPVIALGGGEDGPQGITQRIEGNDVGSGDGRHGRVCERKGREEWVLVRN